MQALSLLLATARSDRYAVIFCGSRSYYNYRHTADSYAMYDQIVNSNGIPAKNVILMCYDDIVNSASNPFKGQIFRDLGHKNIYPGASNIAYSGAKVTAKNFYNVLTGDSSNGPALTSTEKDNLLIFFDNHGGDGILGVPEGCGGYIYADELRETLVKMFEKKLCKYCYFPITACYSGSVAKVCADIPNLFMMTAANDHESSYATLYDPTLGEYLSSEFSVTTNTYWAAHPDATIGESYEPIRDAVKESHVMCYGDESLKAMKLKDFIGYPVQKKAVAPIAKTSMIFKSSETVARISQLQLAASNMKTSSLIEAKFNIALEKTADAQVDGLIDSLRNKFAANAAFDKPCENIKWAAYRKVLTHLQSKNIYLGESFYAKTRFFSNLCNVADADAIIAHIDKVL